MSNCMRGIRCELAQNDIGKFLLYFTKKDLDYFTPWCSYIKENGRGIPNTVQNIQLTSTDLTNLMRYSLWEFVLHIYPSDAEKKSIRSYSDYLNSNCICCIIYYDCGVTEIYAKDKHMLREIEDLAIQLNVPFVTYITDDTDDRKVMLP